ncbi:hypothetical protein [Hydrogenimonas sp.]
MGYCNSGRSTKIKPAFLDASEIEVESGCGVYFDYAAFLFAAGGGSVSVYRAESTDGTDSIVVRDGAMAGRIASIVHERIKPGFSKVVEVMSRGEILYVRCIAGDVVKIHIAPSTAKFVGIETDVVKMSRSGKLYKVFKSRYFDETDTIVFARDEEHGAFIPLLDDGSGNPIVTVYWTPKHGDIILDARGNLSTGWDVPPKLIDIVGTDEKTYLVTKESDDTDTYYLNERNEDGTTGAVIACKGYEMVPIHTAAVLKPNEYVNSNGTWVCSFPPAQSSWLHTNAVIEPITWAGIGHLGEVVSVEPKMRATVTGSVPTAGGDRIVLTYLDTSGELHVIGGEKVEVSSVDGFFNHVYRHDMRGSLVVSGDHKRLAGFSFAGVVPATKDSVVKPFHWGEY